jgi:hypothetical protein
MPGGVLLAPVHPRKPVECLSDMREDHDYEAACTDSLQERRDRLVSDVRCDRPRKQTSDRHQRRERFDQRGVHDPAMDSLRSGPAEPRGAGGSKVTSRRVRDATASTSRRSDCVRCTASKAPARTARGLKTLPPSGVSVTPRMRRPASTSSRSTARPPTCGHLPRELVDQLGIDVLDGVNQRGDRRYGFAA